MLRSIHIISLTFFLLILKENVNCAKILGIFHVPGPSHHLAGSTLMNILAENGHEVTVITSFESNNPPKNYKEIVLDGIQNEIMQTRVNFFEMNMNGLIAPAIFTILSTKMIELAFNHTKFKKLMDSDVKFDVVIVEQFQAEAMKYVAKHFNAHLIVYNALDANEWVNPYQGNPSSPAYIPSIFIEEYTNEMTFFQRIHNTIQYVYQELIRNFVMIPMHNRMLHKYYPDAPHLNDFIYNVSLVLLNADLSVYEATPRVPSMVNIGGFHIKQPKKLPEDLQEILDKATDGVVYFSMGSNIKSVDMPIEKRQFILKVLSTLKEKVIWKFEDENLPGKPDNVIIRKWLPQNDILAHKNVKLFITHGGIFSTMEAVHHGVPLLTLPVMPEQTNNAKKAEMNGYAKSIIFRDLNEEQFSLYLTELLKNPKYKENALKRSKIMKDKPLTAVKSVNYWVDYVIKHKGAPHLRVASLNLNWYQYLLLDVIAFISISIVSFIYLINLLIKILFKKNNKNKEKLQ